MWSFSRNVTKLLLMLALLAPTGLLAGCTGLTPIYDDTATPPLRFAYASPANRLEQVIYQRLALRLGEANAPGVALVAIAASSASQQLTSDVVAAPSTQYEMTVTAHIKVTDAAGKILFTGSRRASALYARGPQILANQSAEIDASERAATALAETIRLTLIAALNS